MVMRDPASTFPANKNYDSLKKCLNPDLGKEMNKISLEIFVVPEGKVSNKDC